MKRYQMGGPTSYAESGSAGGSNISFKDAFKEARKAGLDSFTWRGKKYTTEVASPKKSEDAEPTKVKKTETMTEVETPVSPRSSGPRSGGRGSKPGMARVGSGRYDDPTSTYGERITAPFRKLGDIFGRRREEQTMRSMGVDRDEARRRLEKLEDVEEMRRGGRVKKYAKGGSVGSASKRADGCAVKGKTRGRMI